MTDPQNRQFRLVRRPNGLPEAEDFELSLAAVPEPAPGEFVVRNHFASLDPAQRGWMSDAPSYMPPIPLGHAVRATTVGIVHSSSCEEFPCGEWVMGLNALEDYSLCRAGGFTNRIDAEAGGSPTAYLSALGAVGLTAYFGLIEAGQPTAGETVLVTGAAGGVGSLVGQIAKISGCRVIGIAGGADKCERLLRDYGFDVAIDYRGRNLEELAAEIAVAAPNGVDVHFENVGGVVLDAALANLALRARVVLCGLISEYNAAEPLGARNLWQVLVKRATVKGFLVADYVERFAEGAAAMGEWIAQGRLRVDEDVQVGLENAYAAFMRLFSGANTGKLVLKIA